MFFYLNFKYFLQKKHFKIVSISSNFFFKKREIKTRCRSWVKYLSAYLRLWQRLRLKVFFTQKCIKAMFVSWKVVFGKSLSKLSCVCLPLGKLVNGKHFPVNRKHFSVNEKHFPVKEKFGLVSRKVFFLLAVFVFRKVISGKSLSKLSCVCLPLEKLVNRKHFPVKKKFGLVFRKVFS